MALGARQELESEHLTEMRGQFTGVKQYKVFNDDGSAIDASQARAASGSPEIGQSFSFAFPSVICVRVEYRHLVGTHHYQVIGHFESQPNYLRPDAVGYLERVQYWRDAPAVTANPEPNTDIGGTKIDINGRPQEVDTWRLRFTLPRTIQGDTIDDIKGQLAADQIGTRNAGIFHGFGIGTVLYLGPQVNPSTPDGSNFGAPKGWNLVNYQFLYDFRYHLKQVPEVIYNGQIDTEYVGVPPQIHAKKVYWRFGPSPVGGNGLTNFEVFP